MSNQTSLIDRIKQSDIWKSIFLSDYPDTNEKRSLAITNSLFLHLHPVKVKTNTLKLTYTWGLGIISFILFAYLTITGVWLMFFYTPSIERAYSDIQALETQLKFGILMRSTHRWAAHLMVLVVFLHMCRVFYTGGYKKPRQFNWVIGVLLWIITLLLSFTGYLLPWDQLSYWAVTVGTNIAGAAPLIGESLREILLGAKEVGQETLVRFYTFHIVLFPIVMAILIGVHFWRIRKDGGLSSPEEAKLVLKEGNE